MMCNNMIVSRAIQAFGLDIMIGDRCPICYANDNSPKRENEPTGEFWVRTLVPHVKKMFVEMGLLNTN